MLLEDWGLGRRLKPGYRALFMGPPGTGKTLTALLIGKALALPVYRIDVLRDFEPQFGEADRILLIEIDLLFAGGDRAANQQVAYLLQRIEDYPGLVILTSTVRDALDQAFRRRFESVIHFAMPDAEERLRLWQLSFDSDGFRLSEDADLHKLAVEHELAGGSIVNVLRHAALMAAARGEPVVHAIDLEEGVRRELAR
jgi:SpoVK/Ycf46/Vps4 family AAA+-type ATPase